MLQVRKLMESDWEILNVWWSQFGQSPWVDGDTFRDIMPGAFQVGEYDKKRRGMGGFMVCKDGEPVAAMWLYIGNGPCAVPTAAISDPYYRDNDRKEALQLLVNFTTDFAKDLGFKYTFAWAEEGFMLDYYLKAGYKKFAKPAYELIKKL